MWDVDRSIAPFSMGENPSATSTDSYARYSGWSRGACRMRMLPSENDSHRPATSQAATPSTQTPTIPKTLTPNVWYQVFAWLDSRDIHQVRQTRQFRHQKTAGLLRQMRVDQCAHGHTQAPQRLHLRNRWINGPSDHVAELAPEMFPKPTSRIDRPKTVHDCKLISTERCRKFFHLQCLR